MTASKDWMNCAAADFAVALTFISFVSNLSVRSKPDDWPMCVKLRFFYLLAENTEPVAVVKTTG